MSSTFSLKYMSRRVSCAFNLLQVCLVVAVLALLVTASPLFAENALNGAENTAEAETEAGAGVTPALLPPPMELP